MHTTSPAEVIKKIACIIDMGIWVIPLCASRPRHTPPPCSTTALLAFPPPSLVASHPWPMYTGHLTVPPSAIRSRRCETE